MANYWKSPYNKTIVVSDQPDRYGPQFTENVDDSQMASLQQTPRFQTHDVSTPHAVKRQLYVQSASTKQDSTKLKGILKTSNEQQKNDSEGMHQHFTSCLTHCRNSAHSAQLKKRVTFDKSMVNDESLFVNKISPQIKTPWIYQQKLKLYQAKNNMATYNLKKLLGTTAKVSGTVQRKLSVPMNQVFGPVYTNGQCRHNVFLKCSSCFKKTPDDGLNKEIENRSKSSSVLDNSENKMTDLCALTNTGHNSEETVATVHQESLKFQDEKFPSNLISIESNPTLPEQKTDSSPQFIQPWSNTVIFLQHWKNLPTTTTYSSGLVESSITDNLGNHSSDIIHNFEILSKLTVTADDKIKSVKTEDNHVLNKISENPRNPMSTLHNFKFHQKTSATKLNMEKNANQYNTIQLPRLTYT